MEKQQQSPSAVRGQGILEWYEALISAALVLLGKVLLCFMPFTDFGVVK